MGVAITSLGTLQVGYHMYASDLWFSFDDATAAACEVSKFPMSLPSQVPCLIGCLAGEFVGHTRIARTLFGRAPRAIRANGGSPVTDSSA